MAASLRKRALRLSYFTVGYNVLEGVASVLAGAAAGSAALIGFGLDSFVESLSGGVMIWRFRHPEGAAHDEQRREQRALKLVGYTFFVLAAYVAYEAGRKLLLAEPPAPSPVGIVITSLSIVVMPVLFVMKRRTARRMESGSFAADAKQTLACVLLSAAVLGGLVLHALTGFWQVDPLVGLLVAAFLVREGVEAVRHGTVCSC